MCTYIIVKHLGGWKKEDVFWGREFFFTQLLRSLLTSHSPGWQKQCQKSEEDPFISMTPLQRRGGGQGRPTSQTTVALSPWKTPPTALSHTITQAEFIQFLNSELINFIRQIVDCQNKAERNMHSTIFYFLSVIITTAATRQSSPCCDCSA